MSTQQSIELVPDNELIGYDDTQGLAHRIVQLVALNIPFSDIFIYEDKPLMIKRPLGIFAVSDAEVTREEIESLFDILEPNWRTIITERAFDRSRNLNAARIRANCFTFNNRKHRGAVIRRFPSRPLPLAELGLTIHAQQFATLDRGLVLVIGDTGQGKSTTLASLLDRINSERSGHILTIEDPIETEIASRKCLVTQREVGLTSDCASFYVGAMDALREKADVVMIGEIRDEDTAREALALAESGPLVFASLHAKSPEQGLAKMSRLLGGSVMQSESLAQALRGVIYQALVPDMGGKFYHLANETITTNASVAQAISRQEFGKIRTLLDSAQVQGGCNTMNSVLIKLMMERKISPQHALAVSTDKEKIRAEIMRR
ncbi:type IV pilus twitching motility protein PilT [Noviherbaspirillum galbum]|uniref:Flp pilus assembly complex ATPase component n=1 Tax=Noviherbaspirillum galbum TaxID=2709383 RepID=A0A6B3SRW3_9BURK|nr:ATPase, T2SS/T4P/T4SS family [Noviherbaspirillum galbum]NEX63434.1 Flp pilus assembly complex ATPase component [Noviherbaspirillum galbum]